jgi:hypothetical protein
MCFLQRPAVPFPAPPSLLSSSPSESAFSGTDEAGSQPKSHRLSTSSTVPGLSVPQRALFDATPGRSLNSAQPIERSAPTMASFPIQNRAGKGFPQFSTAVRPVSTRLWGDMHLNY